MTHDPILDDFFHATAFAAFIQQARLEGDWPDPEKTRRRAYKLYEEGKAARLAAAPQQPIALSADPGGHRLTSCPDP